ncbi:hypothetical protein NXG27_00835 [Megasphaera paucivorans]|uniref:Uncharacterized protein n=1 Tax=Megasphaera paucivorans TaxID=349095 RepID=A0A1G9QAQ1_9FIRM|nr:hypothetical protein [Megasphaera paucivorans]SDM08039.1 hypothetical protein SAMN05660299_00169 [Megasphaera paucivorans]
MIQKSLKDWIQEYEKGTGNKFECLKDFTLWYLPNRGFCQFTMLPNEKLIFIRDTCNDAHFWRDTMECLAHQYGYDFLMTLCIRHILPYIRYFGWTIEQKFTVNGFKRYICSDQENREIVITAKYVGVHGEIYYYVTQAMHKQYKKWKTVNG